MFPALGAPFPATPSGELDAGSIGEQAALLFFDVTSLCLVSQNILNKVLA